MQFSQQNLKPFISVNWTSRRWARGEQRLPTSQVSIKQAIKQLTQTFTCSLDFKVTKQNQLDRRAGSWTILPSLQGKQHRGVCNHQEGGQVTKHQPGKVSVEMTHSSRTFQVQQITRLFCLRILWGFFP